MDTVTGRLSEAISQPELSQMWESERAALGVPELVIESAGSQVTLRFAAGDGDAEHRKLKNVFENALHRFRPNVRVDWTQ